MKYLQLVIIYCIIYVLFSYSDILEKQKLLLNTLNNNVTIEFQIKCPVIKCLNDDNETDRRYDSLLLLLQTYFGYNKIKYIIKVYKIYLIGRIKLLYISNSTIKQ